MKDLPLVTLIGADCVDINRLITAADICQKDFTFGAVKLLSSVKSRDPRVIKIPRISSTKEYSDFCIKKMATYVDTPYALIIQYDGFILNPAAWSNNFLNYDYIGAPWYHLNDLRVGNGGFSLRSKKLLDYVAKHYKFIGGFLHPEDIWISALARPYLEKAGMKFAPTQVAARFSKEGNLRGLTWDGEFGFHGGSYTDLSKWFKKHPEYKSRVGFTFDKTRIKRHKARLRLRKKVTA